MSVTPLVLARTYLFRLVTNLDPARLAAAEQGQPSAALLGLVRRATRSGPLAIAEGPARGLLLSGEYTPLGHVQAFGLVRGLLEMPVQEALRRTVRPGSVVCDVGANVGFFTLLAARLTGPDGRVESFEPLPANACALRANVALNRLTQVHVHEMALGERSGHEPFLETDERSWSHLADRGPHHGTRRELTVRVESIDAQINSGALPPPDVIKIDVEGSEIAVLEGATQTLRDHRPIVVCELHETNHEVYELLTAHGYELENLDGPVGVLEAGAARVLARPRASG